METSTDQILTLVHTQGVIRPRDLVTRNIATVALTRMVKNGTLVRVAAGAVCAAESAGLGIRISWRGCG